MQPESLRALLECRSMAESDARARCLDERIDRFAADIDEGRVHVLDESALAAAEQGGFGLAALSPRRLLPSHGGADAEAAGGWARYPGSGVQVERSSDGDVQALSGLPVYSIRHARDGKLIVVLENGQVWRQTDGRPIRLPRPEQTVTLDIERGAMGSFFMRLSHVNPRVRAVRDQ